MSGECLAMNPTSPTGTSFFTDVARNHQRSGEDWFPLLIDADKNK